MQLGEPAAAVLEEVNRCGLTYSEGDVCNTALQGRDHVSEGVAITYPNKSNIPRHLFVSGGPSWAAGSIPSVIFQRHDASLCTAHPSMATGYDPGPPPRRLSAAHWSSPSRDPNLIVIAR